MIKGISLKKGLIKWKWSLIYMLVGKLHIKIVQKEHDDPIIGHQNERATRVAMGKLFYWPPGCVPI